VSARPPVPRVNLRFLFVHAPDLRAVRRFYGEGLGLEETSWQESEGFAWLAYRSEGLELMFFRDAGARPPGAGWADQPGWAGGSDPVVSWSVEVPEADYAATVGRLRGLGAPRRAERPEWRQDSYWGFTVKDPAGHTVEVWCLPAARPASTVWPERGAD